MIKDFQIRPSCAGIRDTDEIDERSEATTQLLYAWIALFLFFGASLDEAKGKMESRVLRLMADARNGREKHFRIRSWGIESLAISLPRKTYGPERSKK